MYTFTLSPPSRSLSPFTLSSPYATAEPWLTLAFSCRSILLATSCCWATSSPPSSSAHLASPLLLHLSPLSSANPSDLPLLFPPTIPLFYSMKIGLGSLFNLSIPFVFLADWIHFCLIIDFLNFLFQLKNLWSVTKAIALPAICKVFAPLCC